VDVPDFRLHVDSILAGIGLVEIVDGGLQVCFCEGCLGMNDGFDVQQDLDGEGARSDLFTGSEGEKGFWSGFIGDETFVEEAGEDVFVVDDSWKRTHGIQGGDGRRSMKREEYLSGGDVLLVGEILQIAKASLAHGSRR
jgi:hypothetical protein